MNKAAWPLAPPPTPAFLVFSYRHSHVCDMSDGSVRKPFPCQESNAFSLKPSGSSHLLSDTGRRVLFSPLGAPVHTVPCCGSILAQPVRYIGEGEGEASGRHNVTKRKPPTRVPAKNVGLRGGPSRARIAPVGRVDSKQSAKEPPVVDASRRPRRSASVLSRKKSAATMISEEEDALTEGCRTLRRSTRTKRRKVEEDDEEYLVNRDVDVEDVDSE